VSEPQVTYNIDVNALCWLAFTYKKFALNLIELNCKRTNRIYRYLLFYKSNVMQVNQQQNFSKIVLMIRQAQYNAIKTVNKEMIDLYWNVGQYISN